MGRPRVDNLSLGGIHVLLVDDSRSVLETITMMLEDSGATVTPVDTADQALDALQRDRPDVLLSDLEMPDKGGYWLIGEVRALPAERGGRTPAAALTGLSGPEHRASVLRAGYQFHLEKPVTLQTLLGVVALLALKE